MADAPVVDFAPSDEQQMLRDTARGFLFEHLPSARLREVVEGNGGFDSGLWKMAAGLGWHSLAIPEEYGGAGYSFVELSVVLEEMGRALFPGPFISTVVMAAKAMLMAGSEQQKAEFLPRIASGETLIAMALREGSRPRDEMTTTATRDGADWVIEGHKSHVIFGHVSDSILVAAHAGSGLSLFLVPTAASGLGIEPVETLDTTRRQTHIGLDRVRVGPDSLVGEEGSGSTVIEAMVHDAQLAVALEEVGAAQWCLETAVAHAQTRYQFGRSIGSFQAIKHRAADMLVAVEHARSAAYFGARVAGDIAEMKVAAPLAWLTAAEAGLMAAAETIQILGGTGFTWEHDAHLYLKRAKASSLMFGGVHAVRRQLADAIGI